MVRLCELFGKSRQAYYQRRNYIYRDEVAAEILRQLVAKERKRMPRLGGRKLLKLIQPKLPQELSLGRDAFFDFLRRQDLLVRNKRRWAKTTQSHHWLKKYPNLIVDFTPTASGQLWVSDITYVSTNEGFGYLSLITDAYSRKIIGWCLGPNLEAKHTVKALKMALRQLPKESKGVYHHSDRGVQYCCDDYVKLLKKHKFQISMTENGDPLENPIAERVNGILKNEWLHDLNFETIDQANRTLRGIIQTYNQYRPHTSLDMLTPEMAHQHHGTLKKHWKNYYKQVINNELKLNTIATESQNTEKQLVNTNTYGLFTKHQSYESPPRPPSG